MPESKTKTHRNLTKSISLHTQFICDLYPAVSAMGEFGTTGGNAVHSRTAYFMPSRKRNRRVTLKPAANE